MSNWLKLMVATTLFCCGCYKADNSGKSNEPPECAITFESSSFRRLMHVDSTLRLESKTNRQLPFSLSFSILSGNAQNYPLQCYFSDLPVGCRLYWDTKSFKLNIRLHNYIDSGMAPGSYFFNINVQVPGRLPQVYPVTLQILPR